MSRCENTVSVTLAGDDVDVEVRGDVYGSDDGIVVRDAEALIAGRWVPAASVGLTDTDVERIEAALAELHDPAPDWGEAPEWRRYCA